MLIGDILKNANFPQLSRKYYIQSDTTVRIDIPVMKFSVVIKTG